MFTNDPYSFVGVAMVKEVHRIVRRDTAETESVTDAKRPTSRRPASLLARLWPQWLRPGSFAARS
jgi:hypothetical protein